MVVPYSKYHVVERPVGLTEAERRRRGRSDRVGRAGRDGGRARRRERLVGALHGAGVARRHDPEVVGRCRLQIRDGLLDGDHARAGAGARGRRLRAVRRRRPVLEEVGRRAAVGIDAAVEPGAVAVIELAASVVTAGGSAVRNVTSAPCVVPAALVATSRKWYVLARGEAGDRGPRPPSRMSPSRRSRSRSSSRRRSRCRTRRTTSSPAPFGFTVPPRVAEVGPTPVAAEVTTTGAEAVVKTPSEPFEVPEAFLATSR